MNRRSAVESYMDGTAYVPAHHAARLLFALHVNDNSIKSFPIQFHISVYAHVCNACPMLYAREHIRAMAIALCSTCIMHLCRIPYCTSTYLTFVTMLVLSDADDSLHQHGLAYSTHGSTISPFLSHNLIKYICWQ